MNTLFLLIAGAAGLGVLAWAWRKGRESSIPKPTPPPPPPARREPICGINIQPGDLDGMAEQLNALKELRIRHVRASWWAWSTTNLANPDGNWSWYPEFKAAGIEVLPIIFAHPDEPKDRKGISMAIRYRTLFDAFGPFPWIQLDNEVDGWKPGDANVGDYALAPGRDPFETGRLWGQQVLDAMEWIQIFDPAVKFVSPGLAWNRPGVEEFLRGMIFACGDALDAVAIHTYGNHVYGEPLSRHVAVRLQGWEGQIWVSEWGTSQWHVGVPDYPAHWDAEEIQLHNWERVLSMDESRFGYERMYGFQLPPDELNFGILNADWSPRKAYLWLKEHRARFPIPGQALRPPFIRSAGIILPRRTPE